MRIYSEYNLIINNFRDRIILDFIHFIEVSTMGLLEDARSKYGGIFRFL